MVQLLEYATVAAPLVAQDPKLLPELADSVVVLVVARLDGFFQDMVSLGTPGNSVPSGATSTTFGVIRSAYPMRKLQFGLRLSF